MTLSGFFTFGRDCNLYANQYYIFINLLYIWHDICLEVPRSSSGEVGYYLHYAIPWAILPRKWGGSYWPGQHKTEDQPMHTYLEIVRKLKAISAVVGCVGLLGLPQAAHSAPIVYTVNQTIGAGSVVGTITTDGTLGTLATVDVTGWNLLLNDGTYTSSLLSSASGNFVVVDGSALSASLSTLTYNYDAGGSADFYFGNSPFTGEV